MPPRARKTTAKAATIEKPKAAVSVLVPWRAGDPDRDQAWAYLRGYWSGAYPEWQIVEGSCPDGEPWRKGVAVADALSRAEANVIVIADADVWCDGVDEAVTAVRFGAGWAIPHHRVLRLTSVASQLVYETAEWPRHRTTLTYAQRPYPGRPGGGIVVTTKAMYAQAPIDTRFCGWGQEDESWALTLRLLAGKEWRGTADLWHLWHQPQKRMSRVAGSQSGVALYKRYVAAARNEPRMRALVSEAA